MKQVGQKDMRTRLAFILEEIMSQSEVASHYPPNAISFSSEISQLHEYIEVSGEYGLAYETIVCAFEKYPFVLSSKCAIALLELGLIFRYKTERFEDKNFDIRSPQ